MIAPVKDPEVSQPAPGRWSVAGEVLLIFLMFFLYAGWSPPAENEAHYLGKAKHYWDSSWCPDDHFLESADAHEVFYWTFGWLTLWLSLPAAAWVGRILTWGLMAWAWQRLSLALVPRQLFGLLSAGLFLCFSHHCQMAGEWVVGGVEAKGFAYVLVLLGAEALVRNRWNRTWLLFGAAAAFHVLVGGWSGVAAGVSWIACGKDRPRFVAMVGGMVGGLLLALPGLIPAATLRWTMDPDWVRQANEIYVFERLGHHLVITSRPSYFIAMHLGLFLVWLVLSLFAASEPGPRRLRGLVAGAVAIAAVGAIIDLATINHTQIAAALLRYYWFRLSDAMLPAGTALASAVFISRTMNSRPEAGKWCLVAAMLLAGLSVGQWNFQRRQDRRPGADMQGRPADAGQRQAAWRNYEQWRRACRWIAQYTQPEDRFLTPLRQQTFKWYAGRSELVTWKDIPQDARGIVEWWKRVQDVWAHSRLTYGGRELSQKLRRDRLFELARRYDCDYILIDRSSQQAIFGRDNQVYPNAFERNDSHRVYVVPPAGDDQPGPRADPPGAD